MDQILRKDLEFKSLYLFLHGMAPTVANIFKAVNMNKWPSG